MSRRGAALALAALALAIPGSAFAQSAGDDQYQDPFAGENESQDDGGSGGGEGGATDPGSGAPPAPAPAPSTPAAPAAETAAPAPTTPTGATLPRSGSGAWWMAALGVLLLGAGIALRRGTAAHPSG